MENQVSIDYEKENKELKQEIDKIKAKSDFNLKCNDEKWKAIVNTQSNEIEWLKKVISGILHI